MAMKRALIGKGLSFALVDYDMVVTEYGEDAAYDYVNIINSVLENMTDKDYETLMRKVLNPADAEKLLKK